MLDPIGDLPPAVYWRRRAVIAVIAIVVVLGLVWVASALALRGGVSTARRPARAASSVSAPDPSGRAAVVPGPTSAVPGTTARTPIASGSPAGSSPSVTSPATPSITRSGLLAPGLTAAPTALSRPSAGHRAPSPQPPATRPSATPSAHPAHSQRPTTTHADCQPGMLSIAMSTGKARYTVSERPTLTVTVHNAGATGCVLPPVTTLVFARSNRLWSSADCGVTAHTAPAELGGRETVSIRTGWDGYTSLPGCPPSHIQVGAGVYQWYAAVGEKMTGAMRLDIYPRG